ncbi:hypothetical protein [Geodermatophilus sp. TF02-6]|uniref:hypothetical protein n=1 Tax=Geodermatophilus sp. TF02-6 TaxID=2250575 RepID=UPI0011BD66CA|nr:hypothetical protein [Geodermatophilus sp. TF02-6]
MAAPIPLSNFVRDYRPVIDSLDDGEVVLSQRGGELLLLSSLRRREGDRHAVAALSHLLAHALERGELVDVLADSLSDEYPWLEFLPAHERRAFLDEFFRVLRASATVDRFSAFDQMIEAWKSTAEIYADPDLLARLGQPGDDAIPAPSPLDSDASTVAGR